MNEIFLIRFILCVNYGEDHGLKTYEKIEHCLKNVNQLIDLKLGNFISIQERETFNLYSAYQYFIDIVRKSNDKEEEIKGLLECSILQEAHKRILKGLKLPFGVTLPGKFSNKRRYTYFHGERYEYSHPEDMHYALATLLDRYNSLFTFVKNEPDEIVKVYNLLKTCAVLVFEFLDLHPFGDGNGRLAQLLFNYCISIFTPFPVPIYNIWDELRKEDYVQILVDIRKSKTRNPDTLATMMIECYWATWKSYLQTLQNYKL